MSKINYYFVCFAVVLAVGCYVLQKLVDRIIETRREVEELANDLRKTEEYLLTQLEHHRKTEMETMSDNLTDKLENGMRTIMDEVNNLKGIVENVDIPTVAFSAHNPADKSLQVNEVLILKSVVINEGKGYDTSSGKFTAPVGGLYHLTAHVCNIEGLVIHYAIVKDGEWIAPSQQFQQPRYGSCSSVSALSILKPGDKVWIMCTSGYPSATQIHDDAHRRNTFIGVLLHK